MSDRKKLVIVISNGADNERASTAWSIANGGVASGFAVLIFLVSSGVDWVRRGAAEQARPNPLDPTIGEMIGTVLDNEGQILVCPPCAAVRGYEQGDLIDGVTLAGSVAMLESVGAGAATLSF